jgi:hypothetical protein
MTYLSHTHLSGVTSVYAGHITRIKREEMGILEPAIRERLGSIHICAQTVIEYLGVNAPDYISLELKWKKRGCFEYCEAFFQIHRQLERLYQQLPWPKKVSKITLVTETPGGKGDLSAVAKVIALMQRYAPNLTFDWSIMNHPELAQPFLSQLNSSKIKVRACRYSDPVDTSPADMMIIGPAKCSWGIDYIDANNRRKLAGSRLAFLENGSDPVEEAIPLMTARHEMLKLSDQVNVRDAYMLFHDKVFSTEYTLGSGLTMGLRKATGVFLDKSRLNAPRSRGYCCSSYVQQIKDSELRKDILSALGGKINPDYDKYSLNSGYAHWSRSWGRFIDFVAIHERNKHVVIVLNQVGEFDKFDTKKFWDHHLTPERLALLKQWGYRSVSIKGVEKNIINAQLNAEKEGRELSIVLRPWFHPQDMKFLQLASERLLATGDNTAAEAWASKCILYLYEDVANMGCKWKFVEQQVDLAMTVYPPLGKFIRLCAQINTLSKGEVDQVIQILQDPRLSKATLDFCNKIVENYSFEELLEGALKRTAWHQVLPKLAEAEAEVMEKEVQSGIIEFIKSTQNPPRTIVLKNLDVVAQHIQNKVREYIRLEQAAGEGCSVM